LELKKIKLLKKKKKKNSNRITVYRSATWPTRPLMRAGGDGTLVYSSLFSWGHLSVLPKETASHGIGQDREPSTLTNGVFEHLWWNRQKQRLKFVGL